MADAHYCQLLTPSILLQDAVNSPAIRPVPDGGYGRHFHHQILRLQLRLGSLLLSRCILGSGEPEPAELYPVFEPIARFHRQPSRSLALETRNRLRHREEIYRLRLPGADNATAEQKVAEAKEGLKSLMVQLPSVASSETGQMAGMLTAFCTIMLAVRCASATEASCHQLSSCSTPRRVSGQWTTL